MQRIPLYEMTDVCCFLIQVSLFSKTRFSPSIHTILLELLELTLKKKILIRATRHVPTSINNALLCELRHTSFSHSFPFSVPTLA